MLYLSPFADENALFSADISLLRRTVLSDTQIELQSLSLSETKIPTVPLELFWPTLMNTGSLVNCLIFEYPETPIVYRIQVSIKSFKSFSSWQRFAKMVPDGHICRERLYWRWVLGGCLCCPSGHQNALVSSWYSLVWDEQAIWDPDRATFNHCDQNTISRNYFGQPWSWPISCIFDCAMFKFEKSGSLHEDVFARVKEVQELTESQRTKLKETLHCFREMWIIYFDHLRWWIFSLWNAEYANKTYWNYFVLAWQCVL